MDIKKTENISNRNIFETKRQCATFSSKMYLKQKMLSINNIDDPYLLSTISSTCTYLFVYYRLLSKFCL